MPDVANIFTGFNQVTEWWKELTTVPCESIRTAMGEEKKWEDEFKLDDAQTELLKDIEKFDDHIILFYIFVKCTRMKSKVL